MERVARLVQETVGARRRGRGFAAVVGNERAAPGVVNEHERATAYAGRLWFDQVEHHLYGDRSVDRRAAAAQDPVAGVRGERVGGRDHLVPGADRVLDRPVGRPFGGAGAGLGGDGRGERQAEEQRQEGAAVLRMPESHRPILPRHFGTPCRGRTACTRASPPGRMAAPAVSYGRSLRPKA